MVKQELPDIQETQGQRVVLGLVAARQTRVQLVELEQRVAQETQAQRVQLVQRVRLVNKVPQVI